MALVSQSLPPSSQIRVLSVQESSCLFFSACFSRRSRPLGKCSEASASLITPKKSREIPHNVASLTEPAIFLQKIETFLGTCSMSPTPRFGGTAIIIVMKRGIDKIPFFLVVVFLKRNTIVLERPWWCHGVGKQRPPAPLIRR